MYYWASYTQLYQYFIPILIPLDASAVFLNGLIWYVLKKYKKTKIVTFWIIYCLSISDVMVGVTGLVYHTLLLVPFLDPKRTPFNSVLRVLVQLQNFYIAVSGHQILAIAIDRCIHMRYFKKYNMIMTHSRARLILLFNIAMCLLLLIPPFFLSGRVQFWYFLSFHIFHIIGTIFIYALYILTYFSVKKRVAALVINSSNDVPHRRTSCINKMYKDSSSSVARFSSGYAEQQLYERVDSVSSTVRLLEIDAGSAQQNASPILAATSPQITINSCKKTSGAGNTVKAHCDSKENNVTFSGTRTKSIKSIRNQKTAAKTLAKRKGLQKLQTRRVKPENELRKATCLILLVLFICYVPTHISNFLVFATGNKHYVSKLIFRVFLLSNSSLNAIILMACSRELRSFIKAIFVAC